MAETKTNLKDLISADNKYKTRSDIYKQTERKIKNENLPWSDISVEKLRDGNGDWSDYEGWKKWVWSKMPDHLKRDWEDTDMLVKIQLYAVMNEIILEER